MNPPCPACISGPTSIDGHAGLSVRTVGGTLLTFECRKCGTHWSRSALRGVFTWATIDERTGRSAAMGMVVPPRSNPFKDSEPWPV